MLFAALIIGIAWTPAALAHGTDGERDAVLEQRLRVAPTDPTLYLRQAEAWWRQGRIVEAETALLTAEALGATSRQTTPLRIRVLRRAGDLAQALALCDATLAAGADATLLRQRAELLAELGQHAESATTYEELLAHAEATPDDVLVAARMMLRIGAAPRALGVLDRSMARLGPLASLQQLAIEIEVTEERFDAALARLDGLLARNPRHSAWRERRRQIAASQSDRTARSDSGEGF